MKDNERVTVRYRNSMLATALFASVALLSACSSSESGTESSMESSTEPSTAFDSSTSQVVKAPDWGHVHKLSLVGDAIFIGSHYGFWKQDVGQEPILLSEPTFDVMGLAGSSDRWLASGHPGPAMEAPSDLGLIESVDGGVTWQSVSLLGDVDFHGLSAVGDVVVGLTAHSGSLLRSIDGGRTWSDLGIPSIFDYAIDPGNPEVILATSERGTLRSEDGGATFTPVMTPEPLAFLAWDEQGLYAASIQGQIFITTDSGVNWDARGSLGFPPSALAADARNVVVLVDDSIWGSSDEGRTFTKRISGSGQH